MNGRLRALQRQLPLAIEGDASGVHQARVATRRLRETVPVLTSGISDARTRKTGKRLRKLTRALGSVRELDVTLSLIEELAAADDLPRPALEDVRWHVDTERTRRRASMLRRLEKLNLDKLGRRLASIAEAIDLAPAQAWRGALARRILTRARSLGARIHQAGHLYAPEQLHQVRIAVKKLRYALELAADAGVAAATPAVRELKRAQATLGRLHDLQVLQGYVAVVQAAPPGGAGAHPEGLAAIAGRIEEQCRLLHGRYVSVAPALLELTARVRTDVVPRLAANRPLKMALAGERPRRAAGGTR